MVGKDKTAPESGDLAHIRPQLREVLERARRARARSRELIARGEAARSRAPR